MQLNYINQKRKIIVVRASCPRLIYKLDDKLDASQLIREKITVSALGVKVLDISYTINLSQILYKFKILHFPFSASASAIALTTYPTKLVWQVRQ